MDVLVLDTELMTLSYFNVAVFTHGYSRTGFDGLLFFNPDCFIASNEIGAFYRCLAVSSHGMVGAGLPAGSGNFYAFPIGQKESWCILVGVLDYPKSSCLLFRCVRVSP